VDQFAGIEYDEFAVRVAEVAMWLIDHQMNVKVSNEFGQYFARLPLKKAAKIIHGNSLRIDWESVVSKEKLHFILGNPPFVGMSLQNTEQKSDMEMIFAGVNGAGVLDYVTAWYIKSAQFIQKTNIACAFVSTSSIAQGEQVSVLWSSLFNTYKVKIYFAHRTFSWKNEAKGNAAVHCVIVGFGLHDIENKRIFDYSNIKGEPTEIRAKNINPYLAVGKDMFIPSRSLPVCIVPSIKRGNSPYDNGHFLLNEQELEQILLSHPEADKFIKRFIGSKEFINGINKFCLWLVGANPSDIKKFPLVLERVEKVRDFRTNAKGIETQKYAAFPSLFRDRNNPDSFIVIPRHSSENRKYIPMGFFDKNSIAGDSCMIIPNGDLFLFGMLTSEMHMTWVKYVCGRLESRFRYSKDIVYNNYPFPENISDKQKQKVETAAQTVLDTRAKYPDSSLADLYDPLTMPPDLVKAHQALDKAVDLCYRPQPFVNELNRIEYLFSLYEALIAPLLKVEKKKRTKKKED